MTDKERRVVRFRMKIQRRKQNGEPHNPERRVLQERRTQTDRRNE